MEEAENVYRKYDALATHLDDRARRVWAATEAKTLGYGDISLVARATSISRRAIHRDLKELNSNEAISQKPRRPTVCKSPAAWIAADPRQVERYQNKNGQTPICIATNCMTIGTTN